MNDINSSNKDPNSLFVLVVGATGNQGGAVARRLIERGHKVRALTRKKDSHKAQELVKLGAEIVEGDLGDVSSLQTAMEGVDAVFAMTTPFEKGTNFEVKSGYLLEFAANTMGINHIVFSLVASSDQKTGIPHFESKYEIEKHLKSVDRPYTIIKPVYFMENLLRPTMISGLKNGKIAVPLPEDRKLQMISLEDLANMVVHIFENRDLFLKRTIEIASDEITGKQIAEILAKVIGIPIEYQELSYDDIKPIGKDFIKNFKWLNEVGYKVDISSLHQRFPEVGWHTFEEWARKQYWRAVSEPVEQKIV
ncbi:MAG: NmrA/HSCARG family protein [Candidatus Thorarchaeota archaeon]